MHEWRLIDGRHWQIISPAPVEDVTVTDASEGTRGRCTEGMVEVRGRMMVEGAGYFDVVEALQRSACVDWIRPDVPRALQTLRRGAWEALSASIPKQAVHFCIDRFEYPEPARRVPLDHGGLERGPRHLCSAAASASVRRPNGRSHAKASEALPYPYGYERDAEACVIDRPWRLYDAEALFPPGTDRARAELDHLWQGDASGARPRCRSPFGVYDMTGNVDEWTTSIVPGERPSILKGGYWGPVRTRCRPSTRAHGENFMFYQQGLRCCSDVPVVAAAEASRQVEGQSPR